MRNLKRALSLTLASVMLLGMMVVGTSALSFKDSDQITNVTAASVMEGIELFQGDGNGNFLPNATVTRAQMAAIVGKMLYGSKLDDTQFKGTNKFTDVPLNHYANGYINLVASLGLMNGTSATTFTPDRTLTTAESALLLCRALGYFQGNELTGNWAEDRLTAVATASKLGLLNGLNLPVDAPLNRDNVAAMTFNALTEVVPVMYNKQFDIYYTDSTAWTRGVQFDWKDTLGYKNFSLLYTDSADKDAFGRPAVTWGTGTVRTTDADGKLDTADGANVNMKNEIVTSPKEADKIYVGEVKSKAIYNDLNLRGTISGANLTIFTDSDTAAASSHGKEVEKDGEAAKNKFGTDGQTVEVYYTKGATAAQDKITMVITSTYLGVVTDANYKQDGKTGIRVDVLGVGMKFIEAQGYKEDDLLLVQMSGSDLKAIVGAPTTVTGEATRVSTDANKALTIDGKKYTQSTLFTAGDNDVVKGETNANLGIEKTYTLYLDQNGCYLAAVEVDDNSQSNLVYVTRIYSGSTLDGEEVKTKAMATVVYTDGTYKNVPLTKVNGGNAATDGTSIGNYDTALGGKLTELVYDEDDNEYELKAIAASDYSSTAIGGTAKIELKTDKRYAKLDGTNNTYLNGDTVYMFVTYKNDTVADGIDKVEVVTGGVNFDIIRTAGPSQMQGAFAVKNGERTASCVVIASAYEDAVKDIVYLKNAQKDVIKDGATYEGWFANSTEKEKINIDNGSFSVVTEDAFYEYSEKSNGNLKLTAVSKDPAADNAGQFLNKKITSMQSDSQGYLMTVTGSTTTFDLNGVNVVDMTDANKSAENSYGSNLTSLSALYRVIDKGDYDVNVSIYVNKDNKVTNLLINSIQNTPAAPVSPTESATPSITTHPADATYAKNATATPLTVVATASDSGTLTYQWKSCDTVDGTYAPIAGATGAALAADKIATDTLGVTYYKCTVTNTKDALTPKSVESNVAAITVKDAVTAPTKVEIGEAGNLQTATAGGSAVALTGVAENDKILVKVTPDGSSTVKAITVEKDGNATGTVTAKVDLTNVGTTGAEVYTGGDAETTGVITVKITMQETDKVDTEFTYKFSVAA